jgi:hypothetical protein
VARFSIRPVSTSSILPGGPNYDVTVSNITNSKQVLSPPVIATHPPAAHAWQLGQPASPGLEMVAEEGMPTGLAGEAKSIATAVEVAQVHLLPGDSVTVRIVAHAGDVLSTASMLSQTNDGFTGLDSMSLADGSHDAIAYDAGTEDNSEAKADVPGPPFGGKNHGPDSAPHQPIRLHPGISGKADVTPDFNWTGPVARYTIQAVGGTGGSDGGVAAMPGMPTTGAADTNLGFGLLAGLAAALILAGFTLRRARASQRQ